MSAIPVHLTADDYGLHPAVNRGIEELARRGCITAVSVMVHPGATLDAAHTLGALGVACGLHLVFVEERPLSEPSALAGLLAPTGHLPRSYKDLAARIGIAPWRAHRLLGEARAQLRRYRELGLPLHFVNSHQHVHLLPPVWVALRPLLRELPRVAVRAGHHAPLSASADGAVAIASRVSHFLSAIDDRPIHEPRGIGSAGRMTADRLRAILASVAVSPPQMPGITAEIVLHPGDEDADLKRRYAHWRYSWPAEKAAAVQIASERSVERLGLRWARAPTTSAESIGSTPG